MSCLWSGPLGFNCWISFAQLLNCMHCWVFMFVLSPFCILVCMYWEMVLRWIGDLWWKQDIYVSWFTPELRVRLVLLNMFGPSGEFFTVRSKAVLLLWILFCYLHFMFVFVMLSCLFLVALWSPAGKGLTSWLLCVMFSCVFVTFPYGVPGLSPGQVWYLTVLIPDLCLLYFVYLKKV